MFRVLVVDDEPAAVEHICSIIKMKCPEYEVCGTAGNGLECIEWVRKNEVDLVITDVKMPVMNGIETVTILKQEYPEVLSMIVSGYQEFEYAQGALKAGASDYILKPVVPEELRKTLEALSTRLIRKYYYEKNNLIRCMCSGETCESSRVKKYFPNENYYVGIVRRNGLPKRFLGSTGLEIYSDIYEMATIYGRDEMEALYLMPKEMLQGQNFVDYLEEAGKKSAQAQDYLTIVYSKVDLPTLNLQSIVQELYRKLDMVSMVGVSQKINVTLPVESSIKASVTIQPPVINSMLSNLEYLLKEQQYEKVGKELKRLYQKWQEEKRTQLWLEYVSRQIAYLLASSTKMGLTMIECEYMMEDAFYYATSAEELMDNLFEIMLKHLKGNEELQKVDSPEFFLLIKDFLIHHMAEAISLQSVCKQFAVSQTYLSKLFRKYEQQSFNRYLTELRLDRASEIMKADKEIFIKDVAGMVGYNDQFYFSRIFRSYTGKSPTEFLEELM